MSARLASWIRFYRSFMPSDSFVYIEIVQRVAHSSTMWDHSLHVYLALSMHYISTIVMIAAIAEDF